MRLCAHCAKELVNEQGEPVYDRYFCSPDTCGKTDRAERMAAKRARGKEVLEHRIEAALRARCKTCRKSLAEGLGTVVSR